MSTTVTYKGNTLATVENTTKTLKTTGKYLEDDITLTDTSIISPITLLYSGEVTDSYSSTSAVSLTTIDLGSSAFTADGILYVQVRDKAGKRDGYYYGTDTFIYNRNPITDPSSSITFDGNSKGNISITFRTSASTHNIAMYGTYVAYGIYPRSLSTAGVLNMYHQYNSTYTLTINSTFTIKVYHIKGPFENWYPTSS